MIITIAITIIGDSCRFYYDSLNFCRKQQQLGGVAPLSIFSHIWGAIRPSPTYSSS